MPETEGELGYLAGIIDGEGNIYISRRKNARDSWWVKLSVTNTDKGLIDWLCEIGGGYYISKPGPKVCYRWGIAAQNDVLAILDAVEPFMVVKADLARRAIALIRSNVLDADEPGAPVLRRRKLDHDEARRLRAAGVSVAEIARRFDVCRDTVYLATKCG